MKALRLKGWEIAEKVQLWEMPLADKVFVEELPGTVTITRELARAMKIICARFQNEGCIIDVQNVASELERVLNPDDTTDRERK